MNFRDMLFWIVARERPSEREMRDARVDAAHRRSIELQRRIDLMATEARGAGLRGKQGK